MIPGQVINIAVVMDLKVLSGVAVGAVGAYAPTLTLRAAPLDKRDAGCIVQASLQILTL